MIAATFTDADRRQLQTVQCALTRQRFTFVLFAVSLVALQIRLVTQQRQQGILAQAVMVIQIFIA